MKRSGRLLTLFILFGTLGQSLSGQSRERLEQERNKLIEQIEIADQQLKNAELTTKSSLDELSALESQISSRESLISNLQQQLEIGNKGLLANSDSISKMDDYLQLLQKDFQSVMRLAHIKRQSYNPWLQLFSAESLNDAILIFRYSDQFNNYLQNKQAEIAHLKHAVTTKSQSITEEQQYTAQLLQAEKENYAQLASARERKTKLVTKLRTEESKLRKERDQKKREREELNSKIEQIILAELKKRSSTTKISNQTLTTQHSLDWPVAKGYISSSFGEQAHPTVTSLKVNNNGIDISTEPNSLVQSVLAGTVVGVTNIPGYDIMIIIEHGKHYTVYSKLSKALVTKEDKVEAGTAVGQLGTSGKLHFEIWEGKQKLNPATWLKKR